MALRNAFENLAVESKQDVQIATMQTLQQLSENMEDLVKVILMLRKQVEALTRVDTGGRLVVNSESTSLASNQTLATLSNLAGMNGIDTRYVVNHLEATRSNQLYNMISKI